ncbi:DinB family protein [Brevibacillus choshinensis]|uniref:DinB family protein n=1 Tax=Brevibacillus choshinensis TaxID=54911 RepID=UPI002E1C5881|nr:DinB family protein [Brevibacillus choshinensis]
MRHLQKTIDDIYRLIDEMIQLVQPISEEKLRWKPADDVWSVLEILCHVEEIIPYWLQEVQTIAESPGSEWGRTHLHEGRLAAVAKANQRTATQIQDGIIGTKKVVERILGNLSMEDLSIESPSRNPRWGTKPMSFVVKHLVVEHLENHLGQIKQTLEQYSVANPNR